MKKNDIITIVIIVIFIVLIGMIVLIMNNKIKTNSNKQVDENNYNSIDSERANEQSESKEAIDNAAKIETNGKRENTIIVITDKESGEKYNIMDKDLELFKILAAEEKDTDESIKDKAIEYKILSKGAQKLGVTLSQNKISKIEEMTNSEQILGRISKNNEIARNNFRERLYNYLIDIEYNSELNKKIYKEIDNADLQVNDRTINDKMQQYVKLTEKIRNSNNLSDDESLNYAKEKFSLITEIESLYLKIIKDKYLVEEM